MRLRQEFHEVSFFFHDRNDRTNRMTEVELKRRKANAVVQKKCDRTRILGDFAISAERSRGEKKVGLSDPFFSFFCEPCLRSSR